MIKNTRFLLILLIPCIAIFNISFASEDRSWIAKSQSFEPLEENLHAKKIVDINYVFNRVIATNPKLASSRFNSNSEMLTKKYAMASYLPDVRIQTRSNELKTASSVLDLVLNNSATLQISQDLFSFGRSVDLTKKANTVVEISKNKLVIQEQNILLQAADVYMRLATNRRKLDLSIQEENLINQFLNIVKSRFDNGYATLTDLYLSESRLARAKSKKIKAFEDIKKAESEFYALVGEYPDYELQIPEFIPLLPKTFEEFSELLRRQNLEIKVSKFSTKAKGFDVNIARSSLLPSVSLKADHTMSMNSSKSPYNQSSLSLGVGIPLFVRGGEQFINLEREKFALQSQRYAQIEVERSINSRAVSLWHTIRTKTMNISAIQSALKASNLAVENMLAEHELGSKTSYDVLNARQEYYETLLALDNEKHEIIVLTYAAMAMLGELSKERLEQQGEGATLSLDSIMNIS